MGQVLQRNGHAPQDVVAQESQDHDPQESHEAQEELHPYKGGEDVIVAVDKGDSPSVGHRTVAYELALSILALNHRGAAAAFQDGAGYLDPGLGLGNLRDGEQCHGHFVVLGLQVRGNHRPVLGDQHGHRIGVRLQGVDQIGKHVYPDIRGEDGYDFAAFVNQGIAVRRHQHLAAFKVIVRFAPGFPAAFHD